mgnify:CR=1 FL=1
MTVFLLQVAQRNNRSTAEMLLLQEDIEIDAQNVMGQTALHVCACYGSLAVAKVLLRCKVRLQLFLKQCHQSFNQSIMLCSYNANNVIVA